jgi:2'-5' RNA ligase
MRLFTGISLPPHVSAALENTISELRPLAPLRWSPGENLHITTKFIGAWADARLPEIEECVASVPTPAPFPIRVAHFGFLPNPHRPKIFLAGVQGGSGLTELAAATDRAVSHLGVPPEQRPYTPHATLARIGQETGQEEIGALRERLAAMPAPEFGAFEVREFHLYLSTAGESGSRYSILNTYPLTGSKAAA